MTSSSPPPNSSGDQRCRVGTSTRDPTGSRPRVIRHRTNHGQTIATIVPAEIVVTADEVFIPTAETVKRVGEVETLHETIEVTTQPEPTAVQEPLTIVRDDKHVPVSHLTVEELNRTAVVVEDITRHVAPKDDVFITTTEQVPVTSVVELERQRETQREAVQESFDTEPTTVKTIATIVPAEIVVTAVRDHFDIITTEKFLPEAV
ncbi:hypothetical protein BV898_01950 [Hypsibius exemplaris]|uniref:Uncharacterized protein n=1 Tax=Hypsibius exemplaris TaxID=2072580 RepID=A0A1W0XAJ1_HYPEX|nr:hypothetical protein BV898_01950 [Hypsibius exemplaris]